MTQLYQINVKLSDNQKKNIADAYKKEKQSSSDSQMMLFVVMTL